MAFQEISKGTFTHAGSGNSACSIGIYKHNPKSVGIRLSREVGRHLNSKYVTLSFGTGEDAGLLYLAPATADAPNAYTISHAGGYERQITTQAKYLGLNSVQTPTVRCPHEFVGAGVIINYRPVIAAQANGAARPAVAAPQRRIEIRPAV